MAFKIAYGGGQEGGVRREHVVCFTKVPRPSAASLNRCWRWELILRRLKSLGLPLLQLVRGVVTPPKALAVGRGEIELIALC